MSNVMPQRLARLDSELMLRLAGLSDDRGVVTVLAARGVASETEIRTTLRRVGPELSALAEEAAALADPHLEGPAHGLVATCSTHERYRFIVPTPVPTLVTVASHADLAPLARAFDAARPVGVVDARLDRIRIFEQGNAEARELEGIVFPTADDWTEHRGPSRANPLRDQESSPQRERYDRRVRVQRARALVSVAQQVRALAAAHHWRGILVAGDPHVAGVFLDRLHTATRLDRHLPGWQSPGELMHALRGELDVVRRSATAAQIEAAYARPAGCAIGLEAVRAAIADGRARGIVLDGPGLGRELDGLVREGLAHGLDVFFADGQLGELEAVICELGTRSG